MVLEEQLEEGDMRCLEELAMKYVQSELPPWFYTVDLTLQSVALYKTEEQEAVRPLGLAHPFFKVIHREVVQQNRATIQEHFEPQQIILSPAGAPKLVFSVRGLLEALDFFEASVGRAR